MQQLRTERLLAFARKLQRAETFFELVNAVQQEAEEATGYSHAWLMVAEDDRLETLRLIEISSKHHDLVWEVAPVLPVKGDALLEEIVSSDRPVVVDDARSDPRTNKAIVEKLQNRTIIGIPLILDRPLGLFGLGTFGEEGVHAPSPEELDYLVGMGAQITVAASRLRLVEGRARAEKERQELERRLVQVQKLESLGLLAGGVAHDFNNLLTVVLSSASLAHSRAPDGAFRNELGAVLEAGGRAKDLTRKLLAMSRSQELDLQALDLNVRLTELIQLAKRLLPETIRVDWIEAARLPLVEGDASQLDQVFMNLLINARDAMPAGGRLSVETEQVLVSEAHTESHPWAKPGRYVLVTVTDTGVGMTREVLARVFEPFFTTKGPRAGTGLGLAVAYGIVRQHGGILSCYSEVSVGTSFKVYLPALARAVDAVRPKFERPLRTGSEHILLAEDDELVRGVAVRILRGAGYRVTAVENGDAACRAAAQERFDLVLLDLVMPGMQCREVVERLRTLDRRQPILVSSGYAAGDNVASLVREEDLRFLRKPYSPDQILGAVRAALDGEPPPSG
jgi:signal transduction histidine kinase/ActR/RegA family two-component response regulator